MNHGGAMPNSCLPSGQEKLFNNIHFSFQSYEACFQMSASWTHGLGNYQGVMKTLLIIYRARKVTLYKLSRLQITQDTDSWRLPDLTTWLFSWFINHHCMLVTRLLSRHIFDYVIVQGEMHSCLVQEYHHIILLVLTLVSDLTYTLCPAILQCAVYLQDAMQSGLFTSSFPLWPLVILLPFANPSVFCSPILSERSSTGWPDAFPYLSCP